MLLNCAIDKHENRSVPRAMNSFVLILMLDLGTRNVVLVSYDVGLELGSLGEVLIWFNGWIQNYVC